MTKTYIVDLAERAGKTFIQGAAAQVALVWAGSGLGVADLLVLSTDEKLLTAGIVGGGAAVISILMSLISGAKTGTASLSPVVAQTAVPQGAPNA